MWSSHKREDKMRKLFWWFLLVSMFMPIYTAIPAQADEKSTAVTGEVIDTYCYTMMGAKGESHRECGLTCARKGIPIAILEQGTDKIYVLLPNKEGTSLPDALIDKMGRTATITGRTYAKGGNQFLRVESFK
jgi:hypothetical protein